MTLSANETRLELFKRITQAQVHHDLFVALRGCTEVPDNLIKFNRNVRFFGGVESALFNSTIVLLYTLYETRIDTINFRQLLKQLRVSIPSADLESYTERLRVIKPTWIRVGVLRNEQVGHQALDRSRTSSNSAATLKYSDVDALLEHARKLLFDISSRHFDTHIDFMENSQNAVNQLLSRLAL